MSEMTLAEWIEAHHHQPNPLRMSVWALERVSEAELPPVMVAAGVQVLQTPVGDQLAFEVPHEREHRPTIESDPVLHEDHAEVWLWQAAWRLWPLTIARGKELGVDGAEGMQEGDPDHESLFAALFDGSDRAVY